jgi:hypothetical protein
MRAKNTGQRDLREDGGHLLYLEQQDGGRLLILDLFGKPKLTVEP